MKSAGEEELERCFELSRTSHDNEAQFFARLLTSIRRVCHDRLRALGSDVLLGRAGTRGGMPQGPHDNGRIRYLRGHVSRLELICLSRTGSDR